MGIPSWSYYIGLRNLEPLPLLFVCQRKVPGSYEAQPKVPLKPPQIFDHRGNRNVSLSRTTLQNKEEQDSKQLAPPFLAGLDVEEIR